MPKKNLCGHAALPQEYYRYCWRIQVQPARMGGISMTLQRAALWAIVIAAAMYLLVAGRGLLLPAVLGLVLWYMVDALADVIERPRIGTVKLPRPLALVAAICT